MNTKFIFITGGVVSSLGKGIVAASLGKLLRARSLSVSIQKLDPYINVDPGTMNPYQHGEVYVTDDGAETDLDLGHYERFIDVSLGKVNNVTSGSIFQEVINKERRGEYLGETVQIIPHITDEIKNRLRAAAENLQSDVLIVEVGGTVGDIEGLPFLEAIRQFKNEVGYRNSVSIHVTLIPFIKAAGEIKTKPSQHSVNSLRNIGIQPDILVCRTEVPLDKSAKYKLSQFTNVPVESVIECRDKESIYQVPIALEQEGLPREVLFRLGLPNNVPDLDSWTLTVDRIVNSYKKLTIAIAGKYTSLTDAYLSVVESVKHAAAAINRGVEIKWISTEECVSFEKTVEILADVDGVIVPGGFGYRGIEGKINVARCARENNIPFLGLCLGMQCVVIEFARNVANMQNANSSEFDENCQEAVIALMPSQEEIINYGGTMRLGKYPCVIDKSSKIYQVYQTDLVQERHRHRYEYNNQYREHFSNLGLKVAGTSPDCKLVEIVEIPTLEWFVACQFHPEFKSRPERPHALFLGLVQAASKINERKLERTITA